MHEGTVSITYLSNTIYMGEAVVGIPHGKGQLFLFDKSVYEGDFCDGDRHGRGTLTYPDGSEYEGEWFDDKINGHGKFTFSDKSVYEGNFCKDKRQGYGTLTYPDGSKYEGAWFDDEIDGWGKRTSSDGAVEEGVFLEGKFIYNPNLSNVHQKEPIVKFGDDYNFRYSAQITFPDRKFYNGRVTQGKMSGPGEMFLPDGRVYLGAFNGEVIMGEVRIIYSKPSEKFRQVVAIFDNYGNVLSKKPLKITFWDGTKATGFLKKGPILSMYDDLTESIEYTSSRDSSTTTPSSTTASSSSSRVVPQTTSQHQTPTSQ